MGEKVDKIENFTLGTIIIIIVGAFLWSFLLPHCTTIIGSSPFGPVAVMVGGSLGRLNGDEERGISIVFALLINIFIAILMTSTLFLHPQLT